MSTATERTSQQTEPPPSDGASSAPGTETPQTSPEAAPVEAEMKFDTIIDFQKTVGQLSQDLHTLFEFALELKLDASAQLLTDVQDRLNVGGFSIAVVGEFKTGKSTFLNALMGLGILPMDIVPATATLNRIRYGQERRVEIHFRDGTTRTIGIEEMSKDVTKIHDDGELARTVKQAVIYYDSPYLLNKVELYDTPGLNDDHEMTAASLSVLPQVDAAILVISAFSPFGEVHVASWRRSYSRPILAASSLW